MGEAGGAIPPESIFLGFPVSGPQSRLRKKWTILTNQVRRETDDDVIWILERGAFQTEVRVRVFHMSILTLSTTTTGNAF